MRFLRAYRERKPDESGKSSPDSESKRSEGGIHKYLLRTVSAFFGRGQDEEEPPVRSSTQAATPVTDPETNPQRRNRCRWKSICGAQSSDADLYIGDYDNDDRSERTFSVESGRNCLSDEEYIIRRSASSVQLPPPITTLRAQGNANNSLLSQSRCGSHDSHSTGTRFTPPSSDDDSQYQRNPNDLRSQFALTNKKEASVSLERDREGIVDRHEAIRPFRARHGSILDGDESTLSYNPQRWWSDDPKVKDIPSRMVMREKRFFKLRNSITSLRRSLSTPKSRNSSSYDLENESEVGQTALARYASHSDREYDSSGSLSDTERPPIQMHMEFGLDVGKLPYIVSPHPSGFRDDAVSTVTHEDQLGTRKERVVVLTAGDPTDVVTLTPAQWDEETVRKIEATFSSLPSLKDSPLNARTEIFQKKLIACQTIVDFGAKKIMQRAIELKRQTLLEIIEYISTTRNCMNERLLQDVIDMVQANVFRCLPPREKKNIMFYDIEEDEPTLENSWPHLQIVYDVFLRVIVSNEVTSKMAKNVIDKPFVLKLLNVLNSEDQRERDYLKTILHRIYGKIMPLRTFIRKAMDNVFTNFIYETENPYGITELLEILGSIINGFAVPLKEEHKVYLEKSLLPLHKPKYVRSYHAALSYCMIQYINKDCSLASVVLRAILKFWPTTSAQTEVLFINELEEVLSLTELAELGGIMKAVAKRLSQCVSSSHFQVAERALYVWNNNRVVRQLNLNKEIVYPYVVPAVKANIENHWNEAVRVLTFNVSKMISEHDPELYNNCVWPCGSSRRFLPVTLTPHNSWEAVLPMGCEALEAAGRLVTPSDNSEYSNSS